MSETIRSHKPFYIMRLDAKDLNDAVHLNFFITGIATRNQRLMFRIVQIYITNKLSGSNVNLSKYPRVFDYEYDSYTGYKIEVKIRKKIPWEVDSPRQIHTELANRIIKIDKSVISVYLDELKTGMGICSNCLFNEAKGQKSEGGEKDALALKPPPSRIGASCPVRPGSAEIPITCRNFQMDLAALRIETIEGEYNGQSEGVESGS